METYARGEHVRVIERSIREIKERGRATCQGLSYERCPRIMIREIQAGIVKALNTFPRKDGISTTMSPGTIVDGREKPRLDIKNISFGSFAYVFTDTDNKMDTRGVWAIAI